MQGSKIKLRHKQISTRRKPKGEVVDPGWESGGPGVGGWKNQLFSYLAGMSPYISLKNKEKTLRASYDRGT